VAGDHVRGRTLFAAKIPFFYRERDILLEARSLRPLGERASLGLGESTAWIVGLCGWVVLLLTSLAILRYAREIEPDLVIMGAHGHGGLKDLIFGTTISPVRHQLDVPMLIVRPGKS